MTVSQKDKRSEQDRPLAGVLAEFAGAQDLMAAAELAREQGYERLEAFSPFPIHGIDQALGVRPTRLPMLVLAAGVFGGVSALAFQWWTNAVDYTYIISGKPLFGLPANIPVTFECVILLAAFAAFFGMLALNGLPKLANPLFRSERFRAATTDGFFLLLPADCANFDPDAASTFMAGCHALHVETLREESESNVLPKGIVATGAVLAAFALVPPVMIASARATTSEKPRLHNFFDMDFQKKFKSQTTSSLFDDGRSMRPRVPGTVARGQLQDRTEYYTGIKTGNQTSASRSHTGEAAGDSRVETDWVTEFPLPISTALMERGRESFNIHCAVCHGRTGQGNGLASLRALQLEQGTWVPPTSIHADYVRQQPVGQLFHTITNGVRKMPAYGHQIPPEDRWAIVLYLRGLQRSQYASIDDVPEELRTSLREIN